MAVLEAANKRMLMLCSGGLGCAALAAVCILPGGTEARSSLSAAVMLAATVYGFAAGASLPDHVQRW